MPAKTPNSKIVEKGKTRETTLRQAVKVILNTSAGPLMGSQNPKA